MPTTKGRGRGGRKANTTTVQIPKQPAAGSEGEEFNFKGISDTSEGGQVVV